MIWGAAVWVGLAVVSSTALAQQQPLTIVEERIAICTVETTRLMQQLADARVRIAALEKQVKPVDEPPK